MCICWEALRQIYPLENVFMGRLFGGSMQHDERGMAQCRSERLCLQRKKTTKTYQQKVLRNNPKVTFYFYELRRLMGIQILQQKFQMALKYNLIVVYPRDEC